MSQTLQNLQTNMEDLFKEYVIYENTGDDKSDRNTALGKLKVSWRIITDLIEEMRLKPDESIKSLMEKRDELQTEINKRKSDADPKDATSILTWADDVYDKLGKAFLLLEALKNKYNGKFTGLSAVAAFGTTTQPAPKTGLFGFGGIF